MAFLPQFISPTEPSPLLSMLELSGVFMATTFIIIAIYDIFAAAMRQRVVGSPTVMAWMRRTFAANDPAMRYLVHRDEGPDDMPAHIKAALTATLLSIPVTGGRLALGTWQGIYLFEHREAPHNREIVLHLGG